MYVCIYQSILQSTHIHIYTYVLTSNSTHEKWRYTTAHFCRRFICSEITTFSFFERSGSLRQPGAPPPPDSRTHLLPIPRMLQTPSFTRSPPLSHQPLLPLRMIPSLFAPPSFPSGPSSFFSLFSLSSLAHPPISFQTSSTSFHAHPPPLPPPPPSSLALPLLPSPLPPPS